MVTLLHGRLLTVFQLTDETLRLAVRHAPRNALTVIGISLTGR